MTSLTSLVQLPHDSFCSRTGYTRAPFIPKNWLLVIEAL